MSAEFMIGVDFGATNLRAGVCTREGGLLSLVRSSTEVEQGVHAVIGRIVNLIQSAVSESDVDPELIKGVGIGACGLVNRERGLLICSSVLPGWRDVPLVDLVTGETRLRVFLENDANAAIFGEWFAGAASGFKHVVGMTLGTGIGGAAILHGRLFEGATGLAGEFGHLTVDPEGPRCNCGNRGCVGLLAGGQGIEQRYKHRADPHGGKGERYIDTKAIFEMAQHGDDLAREIVGETARYLGIAVGSLLSCFNPEMLVMTGGLTLAGENLLVAIRKEASQRTYSTVFDAARIDFGRFGDTAGIIGAAGIVFHDPAAGSPPTSAWNDLRRI